MDSFPPFKLRRQLPTPCSLSAEKWINQLCLFTEQVSMCQKEQGRKLIHQLLDKFEEYAQGHYCQRHSVHTAKSEKKKKKKNNDATGICNPIHQ